MLVYIDNVDGCSNIDDVLFEDSNTGLYKNPKIIKIDRIRPAINMDAPATCIGECFKISLLRNRTARAKPSAERIASMSPNLIIDNSEGNIVVDGVIFDVLILSTTLMVRSLANAKASPINPKLMPIR